MLNYSTLKNEKIVKEYLDGICIVIQWGIDPKQSVNKALQVLEYVDSELGINELNKSIDQNDSQNFISTSSLNIKNLSKFYFFISKLSKKIDGFCHAEPIEYAHKIKYLSDSKESFTIEDSSAERAFCGITRIWVSNNMRRKGIATRLLECVCDNFLYIRKLEPNQLAFSDPTEFGRLLAKSFTKSSSFLIYNNQKLN